MHALNTVPKEDDVLLLNCTECLTHVAEFEHLADAEHFHDGHVLSGYIKE